MDTTSVGDEIRTHDLCVVQENRAVLMRGQDRVSILPVDKAAIGEIGGVERSGQSMACQCR